MASRICLIDGTYELFRAFYGAPSRVSSAGVEIGATMSLGRSLRALGQSGAFSHFAVAFDTVIESFRNQLFAGYKTGDGIDPSLFGQFALAEEMAAAEGFYVASMVEFEADDAIATLALQFSSDEQVEEIAIASPDKDLMQCAGGKVYCWDRMREKKYDQEGVVLKMGVEPKSIPDYLALVGDTADGIPGVPRWGARSSAQVLSVYKHLESIPTDPKDWTVKVRGAAALAEQLAQHQKEAELYRVLATLRTDVDLQVKLSDLAYRGPDEARLSALKARLG